MMKYSYITLFLLFISCKSDINEKNLDEKSMELIKKSINENEVLIDTYNEIYTSEIDTIRLNDLIEIISDDYRNTKIPFDKKESWEKWKVFCDSMKTRIESNLEYDFLGYKRTHRYRIQRQPRTRNYEPPMSFIIDRVFLFNKDLKYIFMWYDNEIKF